jgi:two-component system cell cycle response regulator DivK
MDLLKDKRIVIVEDNVSNMAVMVTALKQQGATVLQDPRNSDTINLLRLYQPIDLILLDLMLRRGVDGYDIFQELSAHPDMAGIPVVVVSASDPAIEIPKVKAAGISGFISKPINLRKFPQHIARCLAGEPVWVTGYD